MIDISLIPEKNGKFYTLTVKDSGIGMSKPDQSKILERFFRAANLIGKVEGNGLGLSMVKTLCEMHQLDLKINSETNKGTTIKINNLRIA